MTAHALSQIFPTIAPMRFTALHRSLGLPPGAVTDEMIDAVVDARLAETTDLDWKSELPPPKNLSGSDFPKDIAAMANSGGGVIVYGISEKQKAATGRGDVGRLDENHERALRQVAISAISPPVFGLTIDCLGEQGRRVVVVEVPASIDGPHLILRNQFFGAPIRNDADTFWMQERQIEAMYRARFEERRNATEALDTLYQEAAAGRDVDTRAWLIAVAQPRIPKLLHRPSREETSNIIWRAKDLTLTFSTRLGTHPLEHVESANLRPGLRSWVAVDAAHRQGERWREAWVSVHHNGAVTVAAAVGGHRSGSDSYHAGGEVEGRDIEGAVSDLMALIRATAEGRGDNEYNTRVGIGWAGQGPLTILTRDGFGHASSASSLPLSRFTPIDTTVTTAVSDADFHQQVWDLAQDCVNQGGVHQLSLLLTPEGER
ncbi:hypothetical protein GCM10009551_043760 [Nocardiopsis tropica]